VDAIYVANKHEIIFSKKIMKDIFLLICVIILLLFIFVMNRSYLEKFEGSSVQSVPDSYPQLKTADNVKELYNFQNIYPKKGEFDYEVGRFPNVVLPGDVVGCGGRREPCYGGSQQVVLNVMPPLDISDRNISPKNGKIGPKKDVEEVGYLYKIMAAYEDNSYKPIYLIRPKGKYPKYEYFIVNKFNEKQKVITPNIHRELGTNDQVKIEGESYFYRVTINATNFPSYPEIVIPNF
jgi:hypothetical protein